MCVESSTWERSEDPLTHCLLAKAWNESSLAFREFAEANQDSRGNSGRSPNGTGTSPTRCWRRPGKGELAAPMQLRMWPWPPPQGSRNHLRNAHLASCRDDSDQPERDRGQACSSLVQAPHQQTFLEGHPLRHLRPREQSTENVSRATIYQIQNELQTKQKRGGGGGEFHDEKQLPDGRAKRRVGEMSRINHFQDRKEKKPS